VDSVTYSDRAQIAPAAEWLSLIIDEAPDLYLLVDLDGVISYANYRAEDFLHCSPAEAVGRSLRDYCYTGEDAILDRLLQGIGDSALPVTSGQLRFSGTEKESEFMTNPENVPQTYDVSARDASALADGAILLIMRNISEQVQMDASWARHYTLDALGRLAGGFSHDFNNLLQIINCYADMIVNSPSIEQSDRESAQEIGVAGARAAALISQLLAFSRRQSSLPVLLDLNEIVVEAEGELRELASHSETGSPIELALHCSSEPCTLRFDHEQLRLILRTIVKNAVDAQPEGGSIEIATAIVEHLELPNLVATDDIPYIALRINDHGCGMDDGILGRMMEPFFTTKELGKGVGLGLSTIHGIIKQNKGYITVDTEIGRGTDVVVYLPLTIVGAGEDVKYVATPPAVELEAVQNQPRILLVEDEDVVLSLVTQILHQVGYRVESAPDIESARLVWQPGAFDLLITDISLPDGNGLDFSNELRASDPELAVLLISGYTIDSMQAAPLDSYTSFLQKPFTRLSLLSSISSLLGAQREPAGSVV
jgi:signal transduction histidine kinase